MEHLVPMVAALTLVLVGVLAHYFGADSRSSIRDLRKKWW